jgi:hypothetical protein
LRSSALQKAPTIPAPPAPEAPPQASKTPDTQTALDQVKGVMGLQINYAHSDSGNATLIAGFLVEM